MIRRRRILYPIIAACTFIPVEAPAPTGDGSALAFTVTSSQRFDKTIIYQDLAFTPRPDAKDAIDWHRPLSEPTRRKVANQKQDLISVPFNEDTKTLVNKWHAPLSIPTRRITTRQQQDYISGPEFPVTDTLEKAWFRPLSEPTRIKVRQNTGSFAAPYQTEVVGTPGDASAFPAVTTTSVRHDKTIIFDDYVAPLYPLDIVAEVIYADKWFAPFSQPRFVKRVTGEEGSLFFVGDDPDKYGWRGRLSEPTRRKPFLEGEYTTAPTQPEANDGIGWHRPFSDPTRRKNFFGGTYTQAPTQPQANDIIGWHRPFSDPTRRKVFLEGEYTQAPTQPQAGDTTVWFKPFSEPVRRKPFLEGYVAWSNWINQTGTGTEYNWFVQPDIPSRLAARRVPEFPSTAQSPYFVPPVSGTGTEYNWWSNLSERIRVRAPVTQQQAVIQGPQNPITVTLEYAWYQPFSQRLDRAKRVSEFPAFSFSPYIITLEYGWYRPFSERLNRAERVPDFPAYAFSPYFEPSLSGTGTEYNWWPNFSERIRVRSPVTQQQAVIQGTQFPFINIGWHRPLSEPTRRKRRINGEEGSVFFVGDFSVTYSWRQPLSEPTRAKPKQHQSTFYTSYIPPVGTGDGKSQPWPDWSKPTRRVTNKQLFAGLTWTTIFQLGEFDPGRVVCVYPDSRQVNVYFDFDVVPLEESSEVSVPLESRVVDVDVESRLVTVTQEPSCQDS